ncbi:hypothetical protein LTS08_000590 [Lithohypha guttulata]|nr:hypothetical protein LTS08_000590 [Lithohypha guttulata]
MSTIDSFLQQIQHGITTHNGRRIADFLVLNFDNLDPEKQKPYQDLHNELNSRYPTNNNNKDAQLSNKVKNSLSSEALRSIHSPFCEAVIGYFRYVRDFAGDSGLLKARKIERVTKQCIAALREDQPGPTMIPVVLYLTNVLRQISINLDRDPELRGLNSGDGSTTSSIGGSGGDDDNISISYVEQTGNTLREAFMKIVKVTNPTNRIIPPAPDHLLSGLYLMLNSCMRIYQHAGKLRNSESILQQLELRCPPISFYPAAQRVTFLYYLGLFYFTSNQFYRALLCLQTAYDMCPKRACNTQRQMILIHLLATNICIGRLPRNILLYDLAAHPISRPFAELNQIIRNGDIGRFHVLMDYTLPPPLSDSADWLLRKRVLLQLKNRCEILVWRSLIYRATKYAGFLGSSEEGRQASMPYVRYSHIHQAACISYARARQMVYDTTGGSVDLNSGSDNEYIDPEFVDSGYSSDEHDNYHEAGGEACYHQPDHTGLHDPTPEDINGVFLSLISQGLLKGFVHHSYPDLLQSRFAIPGVRRPQSKAFDSIATQAGHTWKDVGFPSIFEVIREREEASDGGVVPGWVTEEKAKRSGGRVINLAGARAVGQ